MRMEELKRGFWGYRKESVYRCIASMEEEFSRRLLEKDAKAAQAEEQLQWRIAELEEELRSLQAERDARRREEASISDTLLKAQAYAERLRAETRQLEDQARERLEREAARQAAELDASRERISRLRAAFRSLLEELDRQAEPLELQAEALQEAPHTAALFPQAEEQPAQVV